MKRLFALSTVVIGLCLVANVEAREHRVEQIPNGEEFSCEACHVGPDPVQNLQEDGPRNDFGQQVEDNLMGSAASGDVDWLAIYDMDADGDGYTNGEELGDPMGEWAEGEEPPQDYEPSNPGDPDDVPDFQECGEGEVFNPDNDECESLEDDSGDGGDEDAGGDSGDEDAGSGGDEDAGDDTDEESDDESDDENMGDDDRACAGAGTHGLPSSLLASMIFLGGLLALRRRSSG